MVILRRWIEGLYIHSPWSGLWWGSGDDDQYSGEWDSTGGAEPGGHITVPTHLHRPLLRSKTSDTGPASQLGLVAWKAASKTRSRMLSQASNLLSYDPNSSQSTKYPRKPPRHQKSKMKRPVVRGWNLWRLAGPGQECRLKAKYAWEGSHPCGGLFEGVCAYIAQARIQLYWSCCSWQYVHK